MSDFSEAFGERLLVARFNYHHITQETLAERAGIHRTQISLLEHGRQIPMLDTFVKLLGAVDQSADKFLGPIRWEPGRPGKQGRFILDEEERE
jgi:transcriptional regulator with XRE-family HTH domain